MGSDYQSGDGETEAVIILTEMGFFAFFLVFFFFLAANLFFFRRIKTFSTENLYTSSSAIFAWKCV